MGWLDRLRGSGDDGHQDPVAPPDGGGDEDAAPVEAITTRRPNPEEQARLDAARAGYAARGIDPADLTSIAAAYDAALAESGEEAAAAESVTVLATAIGDHLTHHGYRWVVSTDPFGTDLAVEPPRRPVPVVVRTLVAVRWMQRETGWVEPVVGHLARTGGG